MGRVRDGLERLTRRRVALPIEWHRRPGQSALERCLTPAACAKPARVDRRIEKRARLTNSVGALPLWDGYGEGDASTRTPDMVRTTASMGRTYRSMAELLAPELVVEFGTAFGVSGMYWLAALESIGRGMLLTFEPNRVWRRLAVENLAAIGSRFESIEGLFEERIDDHLLPGQRIDLAFVDAIHTSDFVHKQVDIIADRGRSGTVVVLDDINFDADMTSCWLELALDPRVGASAQLGQRVGLLELE